MNEAKYKVAEHFFLKMIDGYVIQNMPMEKYDYKYYYVNDTLIFCYNIETNCGWFPSTEFSSLLRTTLNLSFDDVWYFYKDMVTKHFNLYIKEVL
jgi:hypothetical protein